MFDDGFYHLPYLPRANVIAAILIGLRMLEAWKTVPSHAIALRFPGHIKSPFWWTPTFCPWKLSWLRTVGFMAEGYCGAAIIQATPSEGFVFCKDYKAHTDDISIRVRRAHTHTYIQYSTAQHSTIQYITLHGITLHYATLHYITLHYIRLYIYIYKYIFIMHA